MRVAFTKMHGAGNDFVVLDGRARPLDLSPAAIARLGCRRTGVGFDQLVLLHRPDPSGAGDADKAGAGEGADVGVRFFNPDGGEAGACGNASRCVALLLDPAGEGRTHRLGTRAGLLPARVLSAGRIEVRMPAPGLHWRDVPLARAADTLHLPLPHDPAGCSMGNPHATFLDAPLDPAAAGPALERDPLFPERCNIGFATMLSPARMRLVVWERGAGLTLACGSGACAAVVNARRRGLAETRVAVEMPGGTLDIEWDGAGPVRMSGPAAISFTGELDLEDPA